MSRLPLFSLCLFLLACAATAAPTSTDERKAESKTIRELAESFKAAQDDPAAQQQIIARALAAGGRVPQGLRSTIYATYSKETTAYWTQLRKLVVKTKETSLDTLLGTDAKTKSDRNTIMQLADFCDQLKSDGGEKTNKLKESFLSREEKVIQGTAKRRKISVRMTKIEQEVFKLSNLVRKQHGLETLKIDPKLIATARDHCRDMQTHNFFAHESPVEGKATPFDRATHFGTTANAENLAAGNVTPAEVVQGWLDSPGHRSNLLHPEMTRCGVGRVGGYWTALYGL
ncbi:MAG: CAP domain-containing protein [Planctomycetota bacterium]|nr:CAP domain-containing protein [Planctomycetota bacterium]